MTNAVAIPMEPGGGRYGTYVFEAANVPCRESGLYGYTVRVLPFHADEGRSFLPGLITWSSAENHHEPLSAAVPGAGYGSR